MSQNKKAYFQGGGGVNEPEPKKKKYKSDPAIVVQPRFKEPFYHNYDLYNTPGEHSPGAGWHDMEKYKSVSEFLKAKRKKLKDKYKADDSWIMDDNSKTKKNPNIEARASIFQTIIKVAIDFPIDDQIETEYGGPMGEVSEDDNPVGQANLTGGYLDEYLPENDFEGKAPTELDFGRDYVDGDIMEKLFNKYLTPSETELFGLPDGIDPNSDLDAEETMDVEEPFTGTSDIGTEVYEDKWNV